MGVLVICSQLDTILVNLIQFVTGARLWSTLVAGCCLRHCRRLPAGVSPSQILQHCSNSVPIAALILSVRKSLRNRRNESTSPVTYNHMRLRNSVVNETFSLQRLPHEADRTGRFRRTI